MPRDYSTYNGGPRLHQILLNMILAHGESDECLEWPFTKTRQGYGELRYKKKRSRAHRVAYQLMNKDFDPALDILHRCDNPPCFNPKHLFQGTNNDNIADRVSKGRSRNGISLGEKHGNTTLTTQDVLNIRSRRAKGESLPSIAADFGITKQSVWQIFKRRSWSHVP